MLNIKLEEIGLKHTSWDWYGTAGYITKHAECGPGVYGLFDKNGDCLYIGMSRDNAKARAKRHKWSLDTDCAYMAIRLCEYPEIVELAYILKNLPRHNGEMKYYHASNPAKYDGNGPNGS